MQETQRPSSHTRCTQAKTEVVSKVQSRDIVHGKFDAEAGRGVPAVAVVKSSATKSTPAFVPVRLRQLVTPSPEIAAATRSAIEIIVGSGRRVLVQEGFDAETLRQVVAALEVVSW